MTTIHVNMQKLVQKLSFVFCSKTSEHKNKIPYHAIHWTKDSNSTRHYEWIQTGLHSTNACDAFLKLCSFYCLWCRLIVRSMNMSNRRHLLSKLFCASACCGLLCFVLWFLFCFICRFWMKSTDGGGASPFKTLKIIQTSWYICQESRFKTLCLLIIL